MRTAFNKKVGDKDMIIFNCKVDNKEINPSDYRDAKEVLNVGCMNHNLFYQAKRIEENIEKSKNEIVKELGDLFSNSEYDLVDNVLDSISDYVEKELDDYEEDPEYFNKDIFRGMTNNVYRRVFQAKSLMKMFNQLNYIDEQKDKISLTKQGVLL